ncbi:MAG TPA: metallophosphoesterase [Nitrospirae bacterium]|nr:metallophosphoesterase [Nitrospirota bacterium]
MKIGIISDIHGNREALRAVLRELAGEGVDKILNAGDNAGYSAFPDECIALLRQEGVEGVMGNYDEAVCFKKPVCGCDYKDEGVAGIGFNSLKWTQENVSKATREYLSGLPKCIELVTKTGKVLVIHGGLEMLNQRIEEDDTVSLEEISSGTGARLVIMGHTHRPFVREICGTVFVNPGSVGRPFDGDPRACFGIIDISERINVLIKRVEYDIERNIRELIAAGLPPEIGIMLRNGRDTHIA